MITETITDLVDNDAYDEECEAQVDVADILSAAIVARITTYLNLYVWEHESGTVLGSEADFNLPGIGKRRPDVAYCSFETLPEVLRTFASVPPDLAVEVVSSRDETDNTDRKLRECKQAGVKLVWVVRPLQQVIEVYKNGNPSGLLGPNDELDGDPVLPGFKIVVSKLFAVPHQVTQ